jgi:hypothetical protein
VVAVVAVLVLAACNTKDFALSGPATTTPTGAPTSAAASSDPPSTSASSSGSSSSAPSSSTVDSGAAAPTTSPPPAPGGALGGDSPGDPSAPSGSPPPIPTDPSLTPLARILADGRCATVAGDAHFTQGFADPAAIAYIVPMGAMVGGHVTPVDHLYIYYPSQNPGPADADPVAAPGDGVVRSVQKLANDFRVVIEHSCDVWSVFIHIQTLSGPLATLNSTVTFDHPWNGRIPVRGGDVLGTDGGQPGYDYSLFDQRVLLEGLNPASYRQAETWKLHTVDPFDYIPEPAKTALLAKDLRSAAPRGGRIDYDRRGTAAGNRFAAGTNGNAGDPANQTAGPVQPGQERGYFDTHLALAPDPIDPTHFIASIGNFGGGAHQYAIDVDPSTIAAEAGPVVLALHDIEYVTTSGGSWHQDAGQAVFVPGLVLRPGPTVVGALVVKVGSDGTLTVDKRPGPDPATAPVLSNTTVVYTH